MFRLILISCSIPFILGNINHLSLHKKIKIQGGRETEIEEVPYQIGLYYFRKFHCGGSIISEKFIITAAHCAVTYPENAYVIAGNKTRTKGEKFMIEKFSVHPDYDSNNIANDIAIIKLLNEFKFSKYIQPIALPKIGETIPDNAMTLVSGWGSMFFGGDPVQNLRSTMIPYINRKQCLIYYNDTYVDEAMICAGFQKGGTNTCSGDSGGPLVYDKKLFGATSWAFKCARPNKPSVFTNIAHPNIRSFITKITNL